MRALTLARAAVLGALALAGCGRPDFPPVPVAGPVPVGTHRWTLSHGGRQRSLLVHRPETGRPPYPVVINFHGGGGDAVGHLAYTEMDRTSDASGFVLVVPDGTGQLGDRLLTWNSGGCCGYARDQAVDDVGFVRAILGHLDQRLAIDPTRVYATGLSNGAMMAYRLAAEAPELVAAAAPVAGAMLLDEFGPTLPVPILHIHSVDDPRALYQGGLGPPFPLTTHRVDHAPVETMLALWAAHNGCGAEPTVLAQRESEPDPEGPAHTATLLSYPDCPPGGEVQLWRLTGVGHVWPGGDRDYLVSILGPSTDILDANTIIWEFFSRQSRGG